MLANSQQARFEQELMQLEMMQAAAANTQTTNPTQYVIQASKQGLTAGEFIRKGCGLVLLSFLSATAALYAYDQLQEVDAEISGSTTFVDVRDSYSVSLQAYQKAATGRSEHDNFGPVKKSWAYTVGFLKTQVEYVPNGSIELSAVDDPDLGFYILVREREGDESRPLEFTFDTPGGEEDNRATIRMRVIDPESCPMDLEDKAKPASYCTPLDSEDSAGLYSDQANSGAYGFRDKTVAVEAATAFDIAARNAYCELAALGSPNVADMMRGNMHGITPYSIAAGAEASAMSALRGDLLPQYGLPITNEYGGFYMLNNSEVALNKEIAKRAGRSLIGMKPDEYQSYAKLVQLDQLLDPNGPVIDPGPTFTTQLLDAIDRSGDIQLPPDDPPITRQNANQSSWVYTCIRSNPESRGGREAVADQWQRDRLGKIGLLPANAIINPAYIDTEATEPGAMIEILSATEARARVLSFREAKNL